MAVVCVPAGSSKPVGVMLSVAVCGAEHALSRLVTWPGVFVSDPQECMLLARVRVCKHERTDSLCASHVVVLVCDIVLGAVMSGPWAVCGAE